MSPAGSQPLPRHDDSRLKTGDASAGADACSIEVLPPLRMVRSRGIGYAVPGFSYDCLTRLIDFPDMPFRIATRVTIKSGRTAQLIRVELPVGGCMTKVAYKRVHRRTWIKKFTALFRTNRTLRTWRMGQEFLRRGIATARPLTVIIPRRYETQRPSFLALEWIEHAQNLHAYCLHAEKEEPLVQQQQMIAAAASLGELVGRMHAQNISHRDLKPGNLLLVKEGSTVRSYVIDLDGSEIHGRLSKRRRLRNLARIVLGIQASPLVRTAICLRFLKAYLRAAGDERSNWKAVWRELATMSAARAARKRRKMAA